MSSHPYASSNNASQIQYLPSTTSMVTNIQNRNTNTNTSTNNNNNSAKSLAFPNLPKQSTPSNSTPIHTNQTSTNTTSTTTNRSSTSAATTNQQLSRRNVHYTAAQLSNHHNSTIHSSYSTPSSHLDRKNHEAIKAQKIKEYLGIAANISDWDFEALQNDIKALGESLMKEVAEKEARDKREQDQILSNYENTAANTILPPSIDPSLLLQKRPATTSASSVVSSVNSAETSDTDDEMDQDHFPLPIQPSELDYDDESKLLKKYEQDEYAIGWRWYWLQLQLHETLKNIDQCDNEIQQCRNQKPPVFDHKKLKSNSASSSSSSKSNESDDVEMEDQDHDEANEDFSSSSRCVGWLRLQQNRKLLPPTSQAIHLRLGNTIHPLYSDHPQMINIPSSSNSNNNEDQQNENESMDDEEDEDLLEDSSTTIRSSRSRNRNRRNRTSSGTGGSSGTNKNKSTSNKNRQRSTSRKRSPSQRKTSTDSALNNSTGSQKKRSSLRRTSDYDIDDVVLPQMGGTVQKIRKIEYKEIFTPTYRLIADYEQKQMLLENNTTTTIINNSLEQTNNHNTVNNNNDNNNTCDINTLDSTLDCNNNNMNDNTNDNLLAAPSNTTTTTTAISSSTTADEEMNDNDSVDTDNENSSSYEDTDDEVYIARHTPKEIDEKNRFAIPKPSTPNKKKRKEKKKKDKKPRPVFTVSSPNSPKRAVHPNSHQDLQHSLPTPKSTRKRKPSRKKQEMAQSLPDLIETLDKDKSKSKSKLQSKYQNLEQQTTNLDQAKPISSSSPPVYVSSHSPLSSVQSTPTHSHNTRRSALFSSPDNSTTTSTQQQSSSSSKKKSKRKKKSTRKKKQQQQQPSNPKVITMNDDSTKIFLRLTSLKDSDSSPPMNATSSLPSPPYFDQDDISTEDDDSETDAPSIMNQPVVPVPVTRPIFTLGKKRKKKTPAKWVISKKTFQGPDSSVYPEPYNNVIYIHKV